ncbi:glutathione S-transferase family protein [Noviherbaspirillum galbum]|uniref:Glutathione S-transferase family protein n=1 Tax=Noviherbaspirillum galbum TaxID=2709383 RepID=A0A6B3SWH6_9BURK|nr:glutathione S-transferase family protein [Noviherbaspirillum galbum]NEX62049.1 glutathione S-transferase family protein [Noviherbaspirillum galbum]
MLKLYYNPGSANLAPHMLLNELKLPHELIFVDQEKGMHRQPEYMKLNPTGRIPVLVDGDMVLFETAAICLHLVDTHPEAGLAPAPGTKERAEFYKWLVYLTNTLQAELITYFYPDRLVDDAAQAAVVKRHAEERVGSMLDLMESHLADKAAAGQGPFFLGDRLSVVDHYAFMLSRWTRGMQNPARNRPQLSRFQQMMLARPAVKKTFEAEGLGEPYV